MPSSPLIVKFKKLDSRAKLPFRKHKGDAAYDLYAIEGGHLPLGVPTVISTGIAFKMPEGYYCEIHNRSSFGQKGITCHLGIIDQDYHGEVSPTLTAIFHPYNIEIGDRVCQIIFKKRIEVEFEETNEEFESDRGKSGFGSTGK